MPWRWPSGQEGRPSPDAVRSRRSRVRGTTRTRGPTARGPRAVPRPPRLHAAGLATALAISPLLAGCAAPFADLQGARLAGRGNVEVTGSFSSLSYAGSGQTEAIQREYTAQLATGAGDNTDWRFRYTRIGPPGGSEGGGINVFGTGPKFALSRDRFAVALPVGFASGEGIDVGDTFQVHPTVFFTYAAASGLDVNLSGKLLLSVRGGEPGFAANLGLGISTDIERWAVRPEVGVLTYTNSEGYFRHLSIGLSWNLGR